ncbi:MAG TPA: hypothetical protein PLF51_15045 [Candidatus Hydrogenedentes bacterium]|nr:hypothetical protein [Candidatus Hydrogenedentota bacterium]
MDPQPNVLQREYRLRFLKTEAYRNEMWRILCRDYFGKLISPDMTVLDLGCGWGEFINHIQAAHKYAMDLNPDAARRPSLESNFSARIVLRLGNCRQNRWTWFLRAIFWSTSGRNPWSSRRSKKRCAA